MADERFTNPDPHFGASPPESGDDDDFRVLALAVVQPQAARLGVAVAQFAVFISRAAAINLMRHGEEGLQTEQEVAGGLVGQPGRDPQTGLLYTRIRAALAVEGQASQYEVEIPPEEWSRLTTVALEDDPDRSQSILVGWYHSHPTFDAYLSPLDQQTQRQFFGEEWHVAIVVGPARHQIQAFHGGAGHPCPLYLDPDETGGRLVPVTYEVTAGGVSTPRGIEWVAPAGTGPHWEAAEPANLAAPPPAVSPSEPVEPLDLYDPAPGDPNAWAAPPAPASAAAPSWVNRLRLSPTVVGLLILAMLFGMVVMLILVLLFRAAGG